MNTYSVIVSNLDDDSVIDTFKTTQSGEFIDRLIERTLARYRSAKHPRIEVSVRELPPKLSLPWSMTTSLAAMKKRGLYCIIHKASPRHVEELRKVIEAPHRDAKLREELTHYLSVIQTWHIAAVSGEFLTQAAAVKRCVQENQCGDWDAHVFQYTADEVRAAMEITTAKGMRGLSTAVVVSGRGNDDIDP
jgi:hypothetical protein